MPRTMDVTPDSSTGKSILSRTLDTAGTVLCLSRSPPRTHYAVGVGLQVKHGSTAEHACVLQSERILIMMVQAHCACAHVHQPVHVRF